MLLGTGWWQLWLNLALTYAVFFLVFSAAVWPISDLIVSEHELFELDLTSVEVAIWYTVGNIVAGGHPFPEPSVWIFALSTALQFLGICINVFLFAVVAAKFQAPHSELVFSDVALFSRRDGVPVFIIRIGNLRCNLVYHPEVKVLLMRHHVTPEGENFMKCVMEIGFRRAGRGRGNGRQQTQCCREFLFILRFQVEGAGGKQSVVERLRC